MSYNRTTLRTYSGLVMDLSAPMGSAINMVDIAYALARINRFTGHTEITVAQHSMSVMKAMYNQVAFPETVLRDTGVGPQQALLIALLHDAHEAYTGDISLPMKAAIGQAAYPSIVNPVTLVKRKIQRVIHGLFGLPLVVPASIRDAITIADEKVLNIEITEVMGWFVTPWTAQEAETRFSAAAHRLWSDPKSSDFINQHSATSPGAKSPSGVPLGAYYEEVS